MTSHVHMLMQDYRLRIAASSSSRESTQPNIEPNITQAADNVTTVKFSYLLAVNKAVVTERAK